MGGCSQVKMIMEMHLCLQLAVYTGLFFTGVPILCYSRNRIKNIVSIPWTEGMVSRKAFMHLYQHSAFLRSCKIYTSPP